MQVDLNKAQMVFASLATGYRPGGFGDKFDTCPDWNPACDIVTAWKTENIGNADIQGLELEFKLLPWQGGQPATHVRPARHAELLMRRR